jgi:transposase
MSSVSRRLPLVPAGVVVERVDVEPDSVIILASLRRGSAACPGCGCISHRLHSRYQRRVADLPWQGRAVVLRIGLRRLRCANPRCARQTFSEGLPGIAPAYARRSERLHLIQRHIGLALGGAAGARLATRLALPVSADTLLRMVSTMAAPAAPTPRVIGIDEWAWRRGHHYGTIIVDLERQAIIDLLPGRDAEEVAAWLRRNPAVEIVARDRAEVYGEAVRQGAPTAVHVADRWHLLRNLSSALQAAVSRYHGAIGTAARQVAAERQKAMLPDPAPSAAQKRAADKHALRHARYAELMQLRAAGASISGIARVIGIEPKTVRAWICRGGPPRWRKPPRRTVLDPYLSYLKQRWNEGCRNAAALTRELARRGADVRPRVVRAWATRQRRISANPLDAPPTSSWRPPSITRTTRLLQANHAALTKDERLFVGRLLAHATGLASTVDLGKRLASLLRKEAQESLDDWLKGANATPLASFARGLCRDIEAVRSALELPWSTSPVEGHINRLKMIKRQMYGRAGFDLLRQRVLHSS